MASPKNSTPTTPALDPNRIPEELKAQPAWVLWRYVQRGDRWTKQPLNAHSGDGADSTDPATWSSFDQALAVYEGCKADGPEAVAGVGFVFAKDGGYSGVDLDRCRDPETGRLAPWAVLVLRLLSSYTEVSPSGCGLKVWCRGRLAFPGGKGGGRRAVAKIPKLAPLSPDGTGEIEAYSFARFFAATGERLDAVRGHALPAAPQERTRELATLHSLCFSSDRLVSPSATDSDSPASAEGNALTAEEIVHKASAAKNGTRFKQLWQGRWEEAGYASQNEADLALCGILAFWTGKDAGAMDAMFRESGLMRDKWDSGRAGSTYGRITLAKAIAECQQVYTPPKAKGCKKAKKDDSDSCGGGPVELLVELATAAGELFHTADGTAYAWCDSDTLAVESAAFRRWLSGAYYGAHQAAPKAGQLDDAINLLAAMARHDGPERPVHVRVASYEGGIYLDLCDQARRVVEVHTGGWRILPAGECPVRFRRPSGMLPLPVPAEGGTVAELRPFVNVADDPGFRLLVAWLLAALRPAGPYPVLALHGEHGSAKSTTARVLRGLVDPSAITLRKEPKCPQDLWIAANNSWVLALDNLSYLTGWLSDALCCVATGGGYAARKLYSDGEEAIFTAQRPALLTSIVEVCQRPDLLDRSLVATLPPIADDERRPEADLWSAYEKARPRLLGALLDALAGALARLDSIELPSLPRMADFARWAAASYAALGWEADTFLSDYAANANAADAIALDADLLTPLLRRLLEGRTCWPKEGETAGPADLLRELTRLAGGPLAVGKLDGWPRRPRDLAGRLRRLAPSLRRCGLLVEFGERETSGERRTPIRLRVLTNE